MLFYIFNLFFLNYIFTFETIKTTDCESSSSFQEQDCLTAVQRGLQEVVEVFSFLFSGKGDDKGTSVIIFFLTT